MSVKLFLIVLNCVTFSDTFLFSESRRDCMVSDWSAWIPFGVKQELRERKILGYPTAGGATCPSDLLDTRKSDHYENPSEIAAKVSTNLLAAASHYSVVSSQAAMDQISVTNYEPPRTNPVHANFHNILFIIDSSSSISSTEFRSTIEQLSRLVRLFCPENNAFGCPTCHQAALIQFSSSVQEVFSFDSNYDSDQIVRSLENLVPIRKSTCTATAFEYAKAMILPYDFEKTDVLILTDGKSNCGGDATAAAKDLQTVADVYALAIGENWVDAVEELDSYVSRLLPDHVFAVDKPMHLKTLVDEADKQMSDLKMPCAPVGP